MTEAEKVSQLLKALRSNLKDQSAALTYIRSDVGRRILAKMDKQHCGEMCRIFLDLLVENDAKNVAKSNSDVEDTFRIFLEDFDGDHVQFFSLSMQIERSKRLRILKFLETIETPILIKITQDPSITEFFNDCLHAVQPGVMEWLAANACTENIKCLLQAEAQELADNINEYIYLTLNLLFKLYSYALTHRDYKIQLFHPLIFEKILLLVYMGHEKQRQCAIKVVNEAIRTDLRTFIKEKRANLWTNFKNTLQSIFCTRMALLIKNCQYDWWALWCLSVELLGVDLHRGHDVINNLLGVEEKAFKSTDMTIRRQAFEAWKKLIDNFALDMAELTPRRINLLCTPLNANNSKTERITITKLDVWWHLIVKVYSTAEKYIHQVIPQFLNFCFGPLGDTPLLSTKCDVLPSPGKRFSKTRVHALDALSQLLVLDPAVRRTIPSILEDRVPRAVTPAMFQTVWKSFVHSVGEAALIATQLTDEELNNRPTLIKVLWTSILTHVGASAPDKKPAMYRELILVINETLTHLKEPSWLNDSLLQVVIPALMGAQQYVQFSDSTIIDFLPRLPIIGLLKNIPKDRMNDLKRLVMHVAKSNIDSTRQRAIPPFLKAMAESLQVAARDEEALRGVSELWVKITDLAMEQTHASTGEDSEIILATFEILINLPIVHCLSVDQGQLLTAAGHWKELYKLYDVVSDKTHSANQILNSVAKTMNHALVCNKKSFNFISHCLDALLNSINYESFFKEKDLPVLVGLLRDVSLHALIQRTAAAELALKAVSSLLITVYGLNQDCVLVYLTALEPVVREMLKPLAVGPLGKEIINTWDTVVIIIRGLARKITTDFLGIYHESLFAALHHDSENISKPAAALLDVKDFREDVRAMLEKLNPGKMKNGSVKKSRVVRPSNFLDRKNPKTSGKKEERRVNPPSPEPRSEDFVPINSEVNLNVNCLTEHQKESLKRVRDDIPAMHNDLSQSQSRDTQDLQDWFKKTSFAAPTVVAGGSKAAVIVLDGESNKENKLKSVVEPVETDSVADSAERRENDETKESQEDFPENSQEEISTGSPRGTQRRGRFLHPRAMSVRGVSSSEPGLSGVTRRGRGRGRFRGIARASQPSTEHEERSREHLKRKGSSETENDRAKRRRTGGLQFSESDSASESENSSTMEIDENLPKRTKKEISRLRIDMVFDNKMPSKLRSKTSDDYIYETGYKRHLMDHKTVRQRGSRLSEGSQSEQSQDLVKKYSRRHSIQELGEKNNVPAVTEVEKTPEKLAELESQDDEVVESSQDTTALLRSPLGKSLERKLSLAAEANNLLAPSVDSAGVKDDNTPDDLNCTQVDTAAIVSETSEAVKSSSGIFSSPKGIRRLSRASTTSGRGAHMLDLVTKFAINEKIEEPKKPEVDESKRERGKELEKLMGSRQEKIFSNMKAREYAASPPPKTFIGLKNDGEKISPRSSLKSDDEEERLETDVLPMLEWSSANPPSLTIMPNSSILKRSRTPAAEDAESKRKRVSFADPPVSKKMGYEVLGSPVKLGKTGSPRPAMSRQRLPKVRTILVPQDPFENELKEVDEENAEASGSDKNIADESKNTPETLNTAQSREVDVRDLCELDITGTSEPLCDSTVFRNDDNLTDSILSQASSQSTQNSMELVEPDMLDDVNPIYPELVECKDPVDTIVPSLVNLLWSRHLVNYLSARGIVTVGDLARLSEREVARIPVKGSPKIPYIKSALEKFARTKMSKENADSTQKVGGQEKMEDNFPKSKKPRLDDASMTEDQSGPPEVTETGVQDSQKDLLDSIDAQIVLENGIRRSSPEVIIALYKDKIRKLGIEAMPNVDFKTMCRDLGLKEVLNHLPDIFKDEDYYKTIQEIYQSKIKPEKCVSGLNSSEFIKTVADKCTLEDILQILMIMMVTEEEESSSCKVTIKGINSIIKYLRDFSDDWETSETISKDHSNPSIAVLTSALKNQTVGEVAETIDKQFPGIVEELLKKNDLSLIDQDKLSKDELLNIYYKICDKISVEDLVDANHMAMKKKFSR